VCELEVVLAKAGDPVAVLVGRIDVDVDDVDLNHLSEARRGGRRSGKRRRPGRQQQDAQSGENLHHRHPSPGKISRIQKGFLQRASH